MVLSVYPDQRISLGTDIHEESVVVQIYNAEEFLVAKANKEFIKKVTDKLSTVFKIKHERLVELTSRFGRLTISLTFLY